MVLVPASELEVYLLSILPSKKGSLSEHLEMMVPHLIVRHDEGRRSAVESGMEPKPVVVHAGWSAVQNTELSPRAFERDEFARHEVEREVTRMNNQKN